MGIVTVLDALTYLPFRYEERGAARKIHQLVPDCVATVAGRVVSADIVRRRGRGTSVFEVVVNDGTGYLRARWFNQPYLAHQVKPGQDIVLSGRVKLGRGPEMDAPDHEISAQEAGASTGLPGILPVYRVAGGISQKQFRRIMQTLVEAYADACPDPLPAGVRNRHGLPLLSESLRQVHCPGSGADLAQWNAGTSPFHRRLVFGELFLFETGLAVLKARVGKEAGISFRSEDRLQRRLRELLPFPLTSAQERVIAAIMRDMEAPYPMHRLLQGDVGCGKTVVALSAMLRAVECGYQAAFMAPTEILAEQQYLTIRRLAAELGITTALVTGASRKDATAVASGDAQVVVGTHALIQEGVTFGRLGLVVIDEQHKFGVVQRSMLRKKAANPDVLVMTATPIPRSLALTLYGDLDYSVIDELPPGRTPVETRLCGPDDRGGILDFIERECSRGRQAYVVYPAVGETESAMLRSATEGYEAFVRLFPNRKVGLLHGRMPQQEREESMESFRSGRTSILVCTTVIEVGVDVPNATAMIIVHAERFGLAQLHQLRGRVGRGTDGAACFLIAYPPLGEEARRRLDAMTRTIDGFRLAEEDLAIRGPGDFLGTRQAGLPDLKIANILRDGRLLDAARTEAFSLVGSDPGLDAAPSLKQAVDVFWKGKIDFLTTG